MSTFQFVWIKISGTDKYDSEGGKLKCHTCSIRTLFLSKICSNSFIKIMFNEYSTCYIPKVRFWALFSSKTGSRLLLETLFRLVYRLKIQEWVWENFDLCETRQIKYHLNGSDDSFFENVVFNEIEFLNQKLWPFKWNLAYFC